MCCHSERPQFAEADGGSRRICGCLSLVPGHDLRAFGQLSALLHGGSVGLQPHEFPPAHFREIKSAAKPRSNPAHPCAVILSDRSSRKRTEGVEESAVAFRSYQGTTSRPSDNSPPRHTEGAWGFSLTNSRPTFSRNQVRGEAAFKSPFENSSCALSHHLLDKYSNQHYPQSPQWIMLSCR
jgi:hypothetical protein